MENIKYKVRGKVWIGGEEGTFLGCGRVVLLERIKQHGSISKAAQSMEMSYKHAWDLVDSMNRQAKASLVITSRGGKGGGNAQVTKEGLELIDAFWNIHKKLLSFLETETKNFPY